MGWNHNRMTDKCHPAIGPARIVTIRGLILLLWAVPLLPAAAQPAGAWPRVAPGLEYVHERIGEAPWSIHVV